MSDEDTGWRWIDLARRTFPNSRSMTDEERRAYRRVLRRYIGLDERVRPEAGGEEDRSE